MRRIEKQLCDAGYRVLNIDYPGVSGTIDSILPNLLERIEDWINPNAVVHYVGHSFGGILTRLIIDSKPEWQQGRCVMLGTPNKGSLMAAYMASHPLMKHFSPKLAKHISPDSDFIQQLPELTIPTGIIAGSQQFSWLVPVSWFYQAATNGAPGDGVVETRNTQCRNMSDFILMPLHHSFMMWDSQLITQIKNFLSEGKFKH
jgi:pimeloyl-ACP methyl ester carboxylesterase